MSHFTTAQTDAMQRLQAACQAFDKARNKQHNTTKRTVISKGAFVRHCSMGSPALTLTLTQGYGVYSPGTPEPCVIKRWPDGHLDLVNFYGLDRDLPVQPVEKLSNRDFIQYLHESGLPRDAIVRIDE